MEAILLLAVCEARYKSCGLGTSLFCSKSSPSLEDRHQGAARQPAVPKSRVAECPHHPAPTGTSALAGGSPSGTHQHWLPARPNGDGYTLFLHVFKDPGGVATACRDSPPHPPTRLMYSGEVSDYD